MNSMPQQAVTNGNGKNEYFLPQLMTLLSFEVMTPVPNIVSRPIWAPFFCSKCCARVLRTANGPAKLAGDNQPYAVPPPAWRGSILSLKFSGEGGSMSTGK